MSRATEAILAGGWVLLTLLIAALGWLPTQLGRDSPTDWLAFLLGMGVGAASRLGCGLPALAGAIATAWPVSLLPWLILLPLSPELQHPFLMFAGIAAGLALWLCVIGLGAVLGSVVVFLLGAVGARTQDRIASRNIGSVPLWAR